MNHPWPLTLLRLLLPTLLTATRVWGVVPISPGVTKTGALMTIGQVDSYSFAAKEGDAVTILLTRTGGPGSNPYLEIHDPNGNLLNAVSSDPTCFIVDQKLLEAGTYTILCRDDTLSQTFPYSLTLIQTPGDNVPEPNEVNTIKPGQTIKGTIGFPADMDAYTFFGTEDDVVTLLITRDIGNGGNPYLELYAPDGTVLTAVSSDPSALIDAAKLTQTGTYLILCRDDGGDEDYPYSLTLIQNPGDNVPEPNEVNTIKPGQTIKGTIGFAADMDAYTFSGNEGDRVTLLIAREKGNGKNPYLELYAPDGTILTAASGDPSALIDAAKLTQTGTYLILCRDDGGNEHYPYSLTLIQNPGDNVHEPNEINTIQPGQTVKGTIGFAADMDAYTFPGNEGDTVTLLIARDKGNGGNPYLELYAPDGTILTAASGDPSALIDAAKLTQTGTYLILCRDDVGDEDYPYSLTLIRTPSPNVNEPGEPVQLVSDQTLRATIGLGDIDVFEIAVVGGDTIGLRVERTSGPGFNPWITLLAPDGSLAAAGYAEPVLNLEVACHATQTGTYRLVCRDDGGYESFDYSLNLSQSPAFASPPDSKEHLSIYQCKGRTTLRWSAEANPLRLMSSESLSNPNWIPVSTPPVLLDGFNYLNPETEKAATYFQLRP